MDRALLDWIVAHRTPTLDRWTKWMARAGDRWSFLLVATVVAVALMVRFRAWRTGVLATIAFVATALINDGLKILIDRPRPDPDLVVWTGAIPGAAMPSNHAARSAALLVVVVLTAPVSRRARGVILALGVLIELVIGAAMVYLGAHWLTDVFAGWGVGAAIAAAVVAVADRVSPVLPEPIGQ